MDGGESSAVDADSVGSSTPNDAPALTARFGLGEGLLAASATVTCVKLLLPIAPPTAGRD